METLGDKLRQLRDEADLSLRELAKKLGGVTAAHLSDIELGRRNPSDDLMDRLAAFFGIKKDDLRAFDLRPPVEEIKRVAHSDPKYGLAFRKLLDQEVSADEILKFVQERSDRGRDK
jgi:transcriptional regulator with XRE-family HTH domain